MMDPRQLGHLIAGVRVEGDAHRERRNPSRISEVVAIAPAGGATEVDAAVQAARQALPAWRNATPETRADILDRAGELVLARRTVLGELLAREEGKTLAEAVGEVVRAGRILKFFAGEALRAHGVTVASVRSGVDVSTYREPVGVVGLITPWNFPIAIPAWKIAPALAFGCAVVMKPSELTPATASVLADVLQEAGLPHGVLNVVFGAGEAGRALAEHPGVQAISFTGSQSTGARVAQAAVLRQARLQMEMGGKNPLVILDDADLDVAVRCALDGAFFGSGQRCTASSRLIVTEAVHDEFVSRLALAMAELKVGDALASGTRVGPLVSEDQLRKVESGVASALAEGAVLAAKCPTPDADGHYFGPTLLTETTAQMGVNMTELFGPVAGVIRVEDLDEALSVANQGEFGLSAGIVTRSLAAAQKFRRDVRAGMVMVNLPTAGVDYHVPFGGVAASSYGPREQGFAAIEFFTQVKTAYVSA